MTFGLLFFFWGGDGALAFWLIVLYNFLLDERAVTFGSVSFFRGEGGRDMTFGLLFFFWGGDGALRFWFSDFFFLFTEMGPYFWISFFF